MHTGQFLTDSLALASVYMYFHICFEVKKEKTTLEIPHDYRFGLSERKRPARRQRSAGPKGPRLLGKQMQTEDKRWIFLLTPPTC